MKALRVSPFSQYRVANEEQLDGRGSAWRCPFLCTLLGSSAFASRLRRDKPTRLQFTDLFRFPPAFIKFRRGKLSPRRHMNYSFL